MSAADVRFLTIEGEDCPAGAKPARFTFRCVNRNRGRRALLDVVECARLLVAGPHAAAHGVKRDPNNANGGRAQWDWDGNRDSPTFSPSVNCASHCGWHGYIRNGRCVDTKGKDEA